MQLEFQKIYVLVLRDLAEFKANGSITGYLKRCYHNGLQGDNMETRVLSRIEFPRARKYLK